LMRYSSSMPNWGGVVLCFLLCGPLWADVMDQEVKRLNHLQTIQNQMTIPEELARVVDVSSQPWAGPAPEYILIQDVHRHPKVQSQVASLIEYGYDHWDARKVFLEGAF